MEEPVTFIAYAWEVRPGDELDGRPVTAIDDDGTTASVTFDGGKVELFDRLVEVTITREKKAAFG